jgi:type I restriction enzyme S subunit
MTSVWPTVPLVDACDRLIDGDWIETKDQGGSDYRLLQVSNVGLGAFRETGNFRWISQETFERLRCSQIHIGDILIARMPDPTGRAWYVNDLPWPAVTAVDVAIATANDDMVDGRFLAYHLNSPAQLSAVAAEATGTTRLRITRRVLAEMPVPIPPLPTQQKIAAVLAAYDELIENNLRRIEILEEMAQAVYREWFVNFRFPSHEDVALVDSPLGPIPEGWEASTLGDESSVVMGQSPKSEFYNDAGVGLPFHQGVTNFGTLFPEHVKYCTVESRIAEAGDTLVSVRAPVGRINVADTRMVIGRGLAAVRSLHDNCPGFHYRQMRHVFREEDSMGGGTIYKAIAKGDLLGVHWLVPPSDLRAAFEAKERPLFSLIANLTQQNRNLRAARDLLLPTLVSGSIDVSHLDIDTEWLAS